MYMCKKFVHVQYIKLMASQMFIAKVLTLRPHKNRQHFMTHRSWLTQKYMLLLLIRFPPDCINTRSAQWIIKFKIIKLSIELHLSPFHGHWSVAKAHILQSAPSRGVNCGGNLTQFGCKIHTLFIAIVVCMNSRKPRPSAVFGKASNEHLAAAFLSLSTSLCARHVSAMNRATEFDRLLD